jgi:hypothetical protein
LNAATQLNINSVRAFTINGLFSSPGFQLALSNTFAGAGAGINTTPDPNVQLSAGKENSFFGVRAGMANVSGNRNSFFGSSAGESNTNGSINSFFGLRAGESNIGGGSNSFFGALAGSGNTGGENNTFIGRNAGSGNTNGDNNTALGYLSSVSSDQQYATAIGASSTATLSNSIYLGRAGGEDTVRIPGSLTKAYTPGTANVAIPVAFGNVTASGIVTGTPNITSATWSSAGICDVVISDITYTTTDFTTVVTPVFGSSSVRMATGSATGGNLRVRVFEFTGGAPALVSNAFHFVVFRNQ